MKALDRLGWPSLNRKFAVIWTIWSVLQSSRGYGVGLLSSRRLFSSSLVANCGRVNHLKVIPKWYPISKSKVDIKGFWKFSTYFWFASMNWNSSLTFFRPTRTPPCNSSTISWLWSVPYYCNFSGDLQSRASWPPWQAWVSHIDWSLRSRSSLSKALKMFKLRQPPSLSSPDSPSNYDWRFGDTLFLADEQLASKQGTEDPRIDLQGKIRLCQYFVRPPGKLAAWL